MVQQLPAAPQPLTQTAKEQAAKGILDGLGELVGGSPGLFDNRPAFIAGSGPSNVVANTVRAISQFNCRQWAAANKSNYSARVNAGNAQLCGPYLQTLNENPIPGKVGPPFVGGQCPTFYNIGFTGTVNELSTGSTITYSGNPTMFGIFGPIQSITVVQEPPNNNFAVRVVHAGGVQSQVVGDSSSTVRLSFVVRRDDNQPDNCGSKDEVIEPPFTVKPTNPVPTSITVNLPGFGPTSVTINPTVSGDPNICFAVLGLCAEVQIGGPSAVGGGGGGDSGPQGGEPRGGTPIAGDPIPGNGGEPSTGVGEDIDFGDPPEGYEWVGCFLNLENVDFVGNIAGSGPENTVYPRTVGNLSLNYGSVRSQAVNVRSAWTDLFRSNPNLAVRGCRVNVLPRVLYEVVPYAVKTCPENICG